MKKTFLFCVLITLASLAMARPANTAVLDGKPIEYDATDLRDTFTGASAWGANGTLTNLFVTWDSNYVYIALQAWQADNNKLVVLVDVDPDAGTGATTTTNWTNVDPSFIKFNDYGWVNGGAFGLDYMVASEGTYNNAIRVNYDGVETPSTNNLDSLFDVGNGAVPEGSPVDMAGLNDTTACPQKGFEVRIPWSTLYSSNRFGTVETNEIVPRDASLRLLAGIHNNDDTSAWSSPDTIPNQAVEDYTNGIVTTATYLDVPLDVNSDGIPDMQSGDVNAPYLRAGTGAVGGSSIYLSFNEPVTIGTVESTANWDVGGAAPTSAVAQGSQGVLLGLATPIADTSLVSVRASGVEDAAGNSRDTGFCLFPAESGIPQAVTVTFQVNTNSGMGISSDHASPTGFFVNGSSLPLEWGTPPLENTPLSAIPGSNGWASADVTFPPGSPTDLQYKYTGIIYGTNNYEAVRLASFADFARPLVINTNGTPQTVIDYLGPAAYPLRNPADTNLPSAHNRLYEDPQRGDAGIRVRREVLFQLDLSLRRRDNLARVMVLGSDPLRGFNDNGTGDPESTDYPDTYVPWADAGVELFDDGTHGDTTADDGVYTRLWALTTDGIDVASEPDAPNSLVGGRAGSFFPEVIPGTLPYQGTWLDGRSPRSFIYKFYVLTTGNNHYESPSADLSYFVEDPEETAQIVLDAFVWDNDILPPPPPSNAPALTGITVTGDTSTVEFENVLSEAVHGVKVSTNALDNVEGYEDYGIRATRISTNDGMGQWEADVTEVSPTKEFYAAYAGLEPDPTPTYWQPNDAIPIGDTTVRVYFCQFQNNLKGYRSMTLTGSFRDPAWDEGQPMSFIGDGTWMTDVVLPAAADGSGVKFKPRGGTGHTWLDGGDFQFIRGTGGVTSTPMPPVPGSLFTITLDAAGTPAAAWTNINLHMGFDNWQDVLDPRPAMTNTGTTIWEYAFEVGSNYTLSVDWVFTDGTEWYSDGNWHAFMAPYYSAP